VVSLRISFEFFPFIPQLKLWVFRRIQNKTIISIPHEIRFPDINNKNGFLIHSIGESVLPAANKSIMSERAIKKLV
jgi:hypothetical protein